MEVPFFISAAVLGALQPAIAEKPKTASRPSTPTAPGSAPPPRRFTSAAAAAPTTFSPAISKRCAEESSHGQEQSGKEEAEAGKADAGARRLPVRAAARAQPSGRKS